MSGFVFHVLTLFPEMIRQATSWSILGRAISSGVITVRVHDIRDYTTDKHRTADDAPYGGGPGMVMKVEPVAKCLDAVRTESPDALAVLLSASGKKFDQRTARRYAASNGLILVCGHYEGVDERVALYCVDEEVSIGDYVVSGGELPALVVLDAVARLLPGVVGNLGSLSEESHESGLLEYPQYTRPAEFRGFKVPEVLLSGNHEEVARWRLEAALDKTRRNRPDLFVQHLTKAGNAWPVAEGESRQPTRSPVAVALIHHPVKDRRGDVVTTSVSSADIHDIARISKTFGAQPYYIVTPVEAQRQLVTRVAHHWKGLSDHPRAAAIESIVVKPTLEEAVADFSNRIAGKPVVAVTGAWLNRDLTSLSTLRSLVANGAYDGLLVVFGTGWGLTSDTCDRADIRIEPIDAGTGFRHLPVRAAVAIVLDRLLGPNI